MSMLGALMDSRLAWSLAILRFCFATA